MFAHGRLYGNSVHTLLHITVLLNEAVYNIIFHNQKRVNQFRYIIAVHMHFRLLYVLCVFGHRGVSYYTDFYLFAIQYSTLSRHVNTSQYFF